MPELTIRPAGKEDAALVLSLIKELADYERLAHEVVATEDDLIRWLFDDPSSPIEVVIAWRRPEGRAPQVGHGVGMHQGPPAERREEIAAEGGGSVGFALFFTSFSTFLGRPGIYLEDLYVKPAFRGRGYGKALLAHLAALVVQRGYGRLEWSVLNWNEPAIGFYEQLGARAQSEWTTYRLVGEPLEALAQSRVSVD